MELENFLTVADAAKISGLSAPHIYRLIRLQKLKFERFGNQYLVEKNSLKNYKPRPVGRPRKDAK